MKGDSGGGGERMGEMGAWGAAMGAASLPATAGTVLYCTVLYCTALYCTVLSTLQCTLYTVYYALKKKNYTEP